MKYLMWMLWWCLVSGSLSGCKKEVDQLKGTYQGTARLLRYKYPELNAPESDTLFTNVLITVSESTSSTRRNAKINLQFNYREIWPNPIENIPVAGDSIKHYIGSRGIILVQNLQGRFVGDSLVLDRTVDDRQVYLHHWVLRTVKQ